MRKSNNFLLYKQNITSLNQDKRVQFLKHTKLKKFTKAKCNIVLPKVLIIEVHEQDFQNLLGMSGIF